ncbi:MULTISPECIES: hypothetical protein [unclassified Modicisalibacter]|uniref:hypothetical protein n=1 Tax=unclassified Modicisalibacter TaxID=2679913 RepID=UPI001CCFAA0F|nr:MULTISPECIES: hypothetical protein [unclassified Modicisalibacter]MBZ9559083.1 hypothetical protein [Modicisalibacter sp. R2A 31.J]MBZ9576806.1 hypothetical protein [Modicisalibacter sp. MOD 31.J]
MANHKLDLLDNAIDSLREALAKYEEGENGDQKAYKFAILHLSHFIELVFKHYIAEQHEFLIYKSPFADKLDKSKTIGFWESVNFISHVTGEMGKNSEFRKDLDWLKRLRNDIEHYKFEMNVEEVRDALGRVFRSVLEFFEFFSDLSLESYVPSELAGAFQELADEYIGKLRRAEREVEEAEKEAFSGYRPKEYDLVRWARLKCESCGNDLMIPDSQSSTGYQCKLCGNEDSFEIPATCDFCGCDGYADDMEAWSDDEGGVELRCYYCSGRHHMDRDD